MRCASTDSAPFWKTAQAPTGSNVLHDTTAAICVYSCVTRRCDLPWRNKIMLSLLYAND